MKSRLLIFILLSISFVLPAQAGCLDWLLGPSPASQLRDRAAHFEDVFKTLDVQDPSTVKLGNYIGHGASGTVAEVEYQGQKAAIKLYTWEKPQPFFVDMWESEVREAIIIQQLLGDLGVAPRVLGIVRGDALKKWMREEKDDFFQLLTPGNDDFKHETYRDVRFAMIMDKFEGVTSKDIYKEYRSRAPQLTITRAQKRDILKQAKRIDSLLTKYRIRGDDFDVILSADLKLQLIDLSFYELGTGLRGSSPRGVELTTETMLNNGNLIRVIK